MESKLNNLPPVSDFDSAYMLAQQAHENGFRGSTFLELWIWIKQRLDLIGLDNTAGLPEEFPAPGSTLSADSKGQWTVLTPGTYNKVTSGTIVVDENQFAFAQYDGVDYNNVRIVDLPDNSGRVPNWEEGMYDKDHVVTVDGVIYRAKEQTNEEPPSDKWEAIGGGDNPYVKEDFPVSYDTFEYRSANRLALIKRITSEKVGLEISITNPDYLFAVDIYKPLSNTKLYSSGWVDGSHTILEKGDIDILVRRRNQNDIPVDLDLDLLGLKTTLLRDYIEELNKELRFDKMLIQGVLKPDSKYFEFGRVNPNTGRDLDNTNVAIRSKNFLDFGEMLLEFRAFDNVRFAVYEQDGDLVTDSGWQTSGYQQYITKPIRIRAEKYPASEIEELDELGYEILTTIKTTEGRVDKIEKVSKEYTYAKNRPSINIIAHMGSHIFGAPKNSLDAYIMSARLGYKYVETDLQVTEDGEFVINHDSTMNAAFTNLDGSALDGTVGIGNNTLQYLRDNFIYNTSIERYKKPIATLSEFLKVCQLYGLVPLLELKGGYNSEYDENLLQEIRRYLKDDEIYIMSFTLNLLKSLRKKTNIQLLLLHSNASVGVDVALENDLVPNVSFENLKEIDVKKVNDKHSHIKAWTVKLQTDYNRMLGMGVTDITTDHLSPELDKYTYHSGLEFADFELDNATVSGGILSISEGGSAKLKIAENSSGNFLFNAHIPFSGEARVAISRGATEVNSGNYSSQELSGYLKINYISNHGNGDYYIIIKNTSIADLKVEGVDLKFKEVII